MTFHRTLNVIVGENNGGKTAVIDAIRTALGNRTFELDDLSYDSKAPRQDRYSKASVVEAIFTELAAADEAQFLEALVRGSAKGKYDARIRVLATRSGDDLQRRVEVGSGASSNRGFDIFRARRVVYLQPLRDPAGERGLRPGRYSQLANLLRSTAKDEVRQQELERIAKTANNKLKSTAAVRDARTLLEENLLALTGPDYAVSPDLGFVEPEFERLAATLEAMAADMQISMNGLGSSNLYYIAAVLADLAKDKSVNYRCLIIEEPEAHLHPHYQILLLRFLEKTAGDPAHPVQVFVTSHSPILASQAAQAGILPLTTRSDGTYVVEPVAEKIDRHLSRRIKQYLDATRSELFFARRLILVEGDAELLLLPALAEALGVNLTERGVTVVSAAGLNFKTFIPFVKGSVLNIPVSLITDKDPDFSRSDDTGIPADSRYLTSLRSLIRGDRKVKILAAERTFEFDLAIPTPNRQYILEAMRRVHPRKTAEFEEEHPAIVGTAFAEEFYSAFFRPKDKKKAASKADFALELAMLLREEKPSDFEVPTYLAKAIEHVVPAKARRG